MPLALILLPSVLAATRERAVTDTLLKVAKHSQHGGNTRHTLLTALRMPAVIAAWQQIRSRWQHERCHAVCAVRRPRPTAARLSCRLREGYSEAGDPGDPATSLARSSKSERGRRLASEAAEEQGRASQGGRISDRKSDPGESGWFCTDTPSLSAVAIPTRDRSRAPPPSPGTQLCGELVKPSKM